MSHSESKKSIELTFVEKEKSVPAQKAKNSSLRKLNNKYMISPITWLRRRNVVALVNPYVVDLNDSNVTNSFMRGRINPQQIDYEGWRGLDFSSCSRSLKSLS